jgi:hypothetical protein
MKRFGYMRDPLCVVACLLYLVNRCWLRQDLGGVFMSGHFNDLLLIPAALPLVLWVQRKLGVRAHDQRPRWQEIGMHVAVWTMAAEIVTPLFTQRATADWRDAIAYAVGALAAGTWWNGPEIA